MVVTLVRWQKILWHPHANCSQYPEVQVSICEILMRIPVQSAHVRQIVNNKVRAMIADLENIIFYHHIKFLD